MTFTVEVVPKGRTDAVAETVVFEGPDPAAWTEVDVSVVLKAMLRAIDRAAHPDAEDRPVFLRGFNWIVEPFGDGVVIALEMGEGAAVAGPFAIGRAELDALITRAITAARLGEPGAPRVH